MLAQARLQTRRQQVQAALKLRGLQNLTDAWPQLWVVLQMAEEAQGKNAILAPTHAAAVPACMRLRVDLL